MPGFLPAPGGRQRGGLRGELGHLGARALVRSLAHAVGGGFLVGRVASALLALLRSPNIASRRPVFEQYDPVVQSRTVRRPDQADAAVLALPDGSAIAVSIDGNGRRVACETEVPSIRHDCHYRK